METAVIGDTTTQSRRGDWLRRVLLIAAAIFVLLLAYVLVATLMSPGDDESPPVTTDDGDGDVTTAAGQAPGDRPVATFGLGRDPVDRVDVRCLLPTRYTPMVVELTNSGSTTTTMDVHLLIVDGAGQAYASVAVAGDLRPGEIREIQPRVKADQPVLLVGGVSRCDILAMQQEWRTVRFGPIGPDSR